MAHTNESSSGGHSTMTSNRSLKHDFSGFLQEIFSDKQRIISHTGTGQYQSSRAVESQVTHSISACGLAAMNCARILFKQAEELKESCQWCGQRDGEHRRDAGRCLLQAMLAPNTAEEIVSICSSWTSNSHLEVEELLQLPIFKKSFLVVNTKYGQTTQSDFRTLLMEMTKVHQPDEASGLVACIITRPPEIVLCMKIPVLGQDVFVIFDSHPRPTHPQGSGFITNSSLVATAEYLDGLLSIDASILSDPSLRWQAELLGHFSGHIVVAKPPIPSNYEIDEILLDATLQLLLLKVEVAQLQDRETSLTSENEYLISRVTELENEQEREGTPPNTKFKGKGRAFEPQASPSGRRPITPDHMVLPAANSSARLESRKLTYEEQLQAEFDAEDRRIASERGFLLQQNQSFDCGICLDTHPQDHIATVDGCGHSFCRECLRGHVTSVIGSARYPIPCPGCVADNAEHQFTVDDTIALTLGISEETFEKLEELQIAKHSIILHCRKCKETMFVDKDEHREAKIIACPLQRCNHVWCKSCEQVIKIGGPQHSCDGSTELQHLMKARGWKPCPGCTTPIQKESGCNHMTCMSPGCNTHFCYVCGQLITKSTSRGQIRAAITAHYRICVLFQDVARP